MASPSRRPSSLGPLLVVALAGATAGCPASTEGGPSATSGCDYVAPDSFDGLNPKVSFSTDVLPIFSRSCAFSTCHGSTTGPANGVFLGNEKARVFAAIVNVKGGELTSMPFVTPGNPR